MTLSFELLTWILCQTNRLTKVNKCAKYFKILQLIKKFWSGQTHTRRDTRTEGRTDRLTNTHTDRGNILYPPPFHGGDLKIIKIYGNVINKLLYPFCFYERTLFFLLFCTLSAVIIIQFADQDQQPRRIRISLS